MEKHYKEMESSTDVFFIKRIWFLVKILMISHTLETEAYQFPINKVYFPNMLNKIIVEIHLAVFDIKSINKFNNKHIT